MAGEYWTKDSTRQMTSIYSIDATLAKQSTCLFFFLGICTNLAESPQFTFLFTMFKYSFIFSLFAICFFDHDYVGEPFWVVDFPNEIFLQ